MSSNSEVDLYMASVTGNVDVSIHAVILLGIMVLRQYQSNFIHLFICCFSQQQLCFGAVHEVVSKTAPYMLVPLHTMCYRTVEVI